MAVPSPPVTRPTSLPVLPAAALCAACGVILGAWALILTTPAPASSLSQPAALPSAETSLVATAEPTETTEIAPVVSDASDVRGSSDVVVSASPFAGRTIAVVGDSLTLSAADELEDGFGVDLVVDAETGRSLYGATSALRRAGQAQPDIVIVGLGTNDWTGPPDYGERIDEAIALLGQTCAVWVNAQVFEDGLAVVNSAIDAAAERHGFVVARWSDLSGPPELHLSDGYHLNQDGQNLYADLVVSTAAAACL